MAEEELVIAQEAPLQPDSATPGLESGRSRWAFGLVLLLTLGGLALSARSGLPRFEAGLLWVARMAPRPWESPPSVREFCAWLDSQPGRVRLIATVDGSQLRVWGYGRSAWGQPEKGWAMPLRVRESPPVVAPSQTLHVLLEARAHWTCQPWPRNRVDQGPLRQRSPAVPWVRSKHLTFRFLQEAPPEFFWIHLRALCRLQLRRWMEGVLNAWPSLRALALATWLADESAFPEPFLKWNQGAGLSHALAVSAQHVVILSTIFQMFWRFVYLVGLGWLWVSQGACTGNGLRRLCDASMIVSAGLLWWVCPGEGSVWRTWVAVLGVGWLRQVGWSTNGLAAGGLCLGLALMVAPGEVSSLGFLLSALGTFVLMACSPSGGGKWWQRYAVLSLGLPIILVPFQLHFFGRWDRDLLIHGIAFCWMWSFVWIPIGFLAPLLAGFDELSPLLGLVEGWFSEFIQGVSSIELHRVVWVRPSFWEAMGWVLLGAALLRQGWARRDCLKRLLHKARAVLLRAARLAAPCVAFRPKSVSNK